MTEWRACFDADLTFLNGGSLAVRDFRLDVAEPDLPVGEVGLLLVRHLGLLMVGEVTVSGLRFVAEPHKGSRGTVPVPARVAGAAGGPGDGALGTLVDLTHPIEDGMVTYPGLPGPQLGVHLSRADSRSHYAPGTEFEIGRIDMVTNTGTYLDAPWHRFAEGADLAGLPLERTAGLPGVVVDVRDSGRREIPATALAATEVTGRAVLLRTGWDRHWRTDAYGTDAPFLSADAARLLATAGAGLVGIDAVNIDDTGDGTRPAHTTLLAAGIPVLEHLTGLDRLPAEGFALHAAPVPVRGLGTFPVRAYAVLPGTVRQVPSRSTH